MVQRIKSIKTKKKILDAATSIIAEKGYHSAKVTEICEVAGVNLASISYHFGDKENLYIEVWKSAFQHSIEKYPPDGAISKDASIEARLKGWIISTLKRATDPDCFDFEIAHAEITNPTGILTETINATIWQVSKPLEDIIRESLGKNAKNEDIQLCIMSVQFQCLNPLIFNRRENQHYPKSIQLDSDLESIAEHVFKFASGGLRQVKKGIIG